MQQGATRLPEFIIKVTHPDPRNEARVSFNLNVKCVLSITVQSGLIHAYTLRFPKTYPLKTHPVFTIQQPIVGVKPEQVAKLNKLIAQEAQAGIGDQVVFKVRHSTSRTSRTQQGTPTSRNGPSSPAPRSSCVSSGARGKLSPGRKARSSNGSTRS